MNMYGEDTRWRQCKDSSHFIPTNNYIDSVTSIKRHFHSFGDFNKIADV